MKGKERSYTLSFEGGGILRVTEDNFISLIKRKKEKGLLYVVDEYGWIIQSVLRKYLFRMPDREEECMNDVLLAVWEHIDDYEPEKGSFKNWLAGVSRYKAIDCKRKYLSDILPISVDQLLVPIKDTGAEKDLLKIELQEEILDSLEEEDREIFKQVFLDEKTIANVAQSMGKKKDIVYQRIHRGRKKLRRIFREGELS